MSIVGKIKELCDNAGTTIAAVERELDLGKGLIRTWDRGSPRYENIRKVADYFGVGVEEITGEDSNDMAKAQNNTERRLLLLARKAMDIPDQQRESIIEMFEKTIDVYLNAKGVKGDD
ncbi:MAG: helix-turn-helix transcriptional regulator [Clostridia bacterium]|nr:helix-turn-helix transcriptional regulator [Clostridia bacterium]